MAFRCLFRRPGSSDPIPRPSAAGLDHRAIITEGQAGRGPGLPQTLRKARSKYLDVRFAQHLIVLYREYMDIHASRCAHTPSHLGIVHVVVRLVWPFKQGKSSVEGGRHKSGIRPIGFRPCTPPLLDPQGFPDEIAEYSRCDTHLLADWACPELIETLRAIMNQPQHLALAMFQNPCVE